MDFLEKLSHQHLYEVMDYFLDKCQKRGFEGDIVIKNGKRYSLKKDSMGFAAEKYAVGVQATIRLVKGSTSGYCYLNDLQKNNIDTAFEFAVKNTIEDSTSSISAYAKLSPMNIEVPSCYDINLNNVDLIIDELDCATNSSIICPSRGVTITRNNELYSNTNGFRLSKAEKSYLYYTSACQVNCDERITSEISIHNYPQNSGKELKSQCLANYHKKKIKKWHGSLKSADIVFTPTVIAQLIELNINTFDGSCLNETGVINWSKEINLFEVPEFKNSLFTMKYDLEGTKKRETLLVKDGKIKNKMHNRQTAYRFNTQTTGHAIRPMKGKLAVGGGLFKITSSAINEDFHQGIIHYITAIQGKYNLKNGIGTVLCDGFVKSDNYDIFSFESRPLTINFYTLFKNILAIGPGNTVSNTGNLSCPLIKLRID